MDGRGSATRPLAGLASMILLAGCAAGATLAPPATATPAPPPGATAAPASPVVAVSGRETCEFLGMSTTSEGEFLVTHDERYRCTEQMSDPRVSGTMEVLISTRRRDTLASYAGTAVLSNAGGAWRGTARGAITYENDRPTNYTCTEYVGEGGYAGLRYIVIGTGSDEGLVQAGWIEPAP